MRCFGFSPRERKGERKSVKSAPECRIHHCRSCDSNEFEARGGTFSVHNSQTTSETTSMDSSGTRRYSNVSQGPSNNLRVFAFSELKAATKNFSRSLLVGEGVFGCVYKGVIRSKDDPHSKIEVAVKQLNRQGFQGQKEWLSEVNILGVVDHANLVKLVGYCAEEDGRRMQWLLVYEFMHHGSVEDHLHSLVTTPLPWSARLRIALDAARGLTYLHEGMDFQIIFRDFKTSNILLDEEWNAKLSDFGLAREGPREGDTHLTTSVVGTLGYAAPEYLDTGRLTSMNDVWSYGVVLYELITGRRPFDPHRPRSEQKLLEWVKQYIGDRKRFHMIVDRRLHGQYSLKIARKLSVVANRCLVSQPKARPKMSEVVGMVRRIVESEANGNPRGGLCSTVNDDAPETGSEHAPETGSELRCSESEKMMDASNIVVLSVGTTRLIWAC